MAPVRGLVGWLDGHSESGENNSIGCHDGQDNRKIEGAVVLGVWGEGSTECGQKVRRSVRCGRGRFGAEGETRRTRRCGDWRSETNWVVAVLQGRRGR